MSALTIRLLTHQDGPTYQQLRLTALQHDGDVFLSSLESEQSKHEESFETELEYAYHPPFFGYYGVFKNDPDSLDANGQSPLIAYCQIDTSYLEKQKHIAFLYNLYVHPDYRRDHIGSQLLTHIKTQMSEHEHVERIFLSCAANNKAGLRFYKRHGFGRCGIKPRSIKWQGSYQDEIEMVCVL